MGKVLDALDDNLTDFVTRQPVFFVATAPSGVDAHVNVSPKGLEGSFAVIDPLTVAYLDLTGSGVETIAHVRDNGRVTLMFCAFDGKPLIVRLYGRGEVLLPGSAGFDGLRVLFPVHAQGVRSVVRVRLDRVSTSCGYGVPLMVYQGDRDKLPAWADRKGHEGVVRYQAERNDASIDGLPGLRGLAGAPASPGTGPSS
jgi:hypothetical protein